VVLKLFNIFTCNRKMKYSAQKRDSDWCMKGKKISYMNTHGTVNRNKNLQ
jgi:hypothetical protein